MPYTDSTMPPSAPRRDDRTFGGRAASVSKRLVRVRQARSARSGRCQDPSAATIPSSRKTGTAMVTVPEKNSASLRATPSSATRARSRRSLPRLRQGGEDLVLHVRGRVGEQHARQGAGMQRRGCPGLASDAQGLVRLHLVEATVVVPTRRAITAVSPVSARRASQDGVRDADELLARDRRPARDAQPRTRPDSQHRPAPRTRIRSGSAGSDRPSTGACPGPAQLVRADLAPVSDREEHPQAAREGTVLGGFFRWAVTAVIIEPDLSGRKDRRAAVAVGAGRRRHQRHTVGDTAVVRITAVRLQRLLVPLDPPFAAAWDPEPRTRLRRDHRPGRDGRGRRRHRVG